MAEQAAQDKILIRYNPRIAYDKGIVQDASLAKRLHFPLQPKVGRQLRQISLLFWMDQKCRKDLRPNVGKQRLENWEIYASCVNNYADCVQCKERRTLHFLRRRKGPLAARTHTAMMLKLKTVVTEGSCRLGFLHLCLERTKRWR